MSVRITVAPFCLHRAPNTVVPVVGNAKYPVLPYLHAGAFLAILRQKAQVGIVSSSPTSRKSRIYLVAVQDHTMRR